MNFCFGRHVLGDCLEVMRRIPDCTADMILTDLPYGTTDCAWDEIIDFSLLWREYDRIAKPNAAVVLFSAEPFTAKLIMSNPRAFRYLWYWIKPYSTGFTFAKYQPMRCVEDICVFYRKMPKYNPQGVKKLDIPKVRKKRAVADSVYKSRTLTKEHVQRYTGYPKNTLEFPSEVFGKNTRLHPTQKPLKLCEYLIKTYTDPGDVVLDSCSGSGTTAEACIRTGRNYIAIEKSETYYSRAGVRLEKAEAETRETFSEIRENTRRLMKYAEDITDLAAETLPPSVVPQSHA